MRQFLIVIICFLSFPIGSSAQTSETFDITTFQPPKGWQKQASQNSIQISTEDKTNGTYCLITLFKSLPATNDSKENFEAAWQTVVKRLVNVSTAPQMASPGTENGWDVQSGFAPFQKDGDKGLAMLVTISGFGRMVNVLVLTNTQAHEQDITAFLESVNLKKPAVEISTTPAKQARPPASQVALPSPAAGGYAFTSTKFDDGWTSTAQRIGSMLRKAILEF